MTVHTTVLSPTKRRANL